ncbi:MAG: radical SAM protein [bacterium]
MIRDYKIIFPVLLGGDLVVSSEHLGVSYLTAVLRKEGYKVKIIEVDIHDEEEKLNEILQFQPNLVGFTTVTFNIGRVIKFSKKIKEFMPETHITLGGHVATIEAENILEECESIDSIVIGEGEETIVELTERLENGLDLNGCLGVFYRKRDKIYKNDRRPLIKNLDILPFPVRDELEEHKLKLPYLRVLGSRGCLGNCAFCGNPSFKRIQKGPPWRGRSPKDFVSEISYLVEKYNIHTFDFVDDTIEDPGGLGKKRIKEICEEIIQRNLDIYFTVRFRAENWSEEDDELLELLVKAGLEKVLIGFEAGNQNGLRLFNKRATVEDNLRVIELLNRHKIFTSYGFINFHPYSTFSDLRDNANFLRGKIGYNLRRYCTRLELYSGAAIKERLKKDGLLSNYNYKSGNLYAYEYVNPKVGTFAREMGRILKDYQEVMDWEIFEIVIYTFIYRVRRKFGDDVRIKNDFEEFEDKIQLIKKEIDENNYEFFMKALELAEYRWNSDRFEEYKRTHVRPFLKKKIEEIKTAQLRFGFKAKKRGVDLSKIEGEPGVIAG